MIIGDICVCVCDGSLSDNRGFCTLEEKEKVKKCRKREVIDKLFFVIELIVYALSFFE